MPEHNYTQREFLYFKDINFGNPDARKKLLEVIADSKEDYAHFELDEEEFYPDNGYWVLAKSCPIDSHFCACSPHDSEGWSCAFYNGFKEKCVFPRTCKNNTNCKVFLNYYSTFDGNISRYYDPKDGLSSGKQIEEKCNDLGLDMFRDWSYAEFDDNGVVVKLAELGTTEQAEQWKRERNEKAIKERNKKYQEQKESAKSEYIALISKYDPKTREDIERLIELSKKL